MSMSMQLYGIETCKKQLIPLGVGSESMSFRLNNSQPIDVAGPLSQK